MTTPLTVEMFLELVQKNTCVVHDGGSRRDVIDADSLTESLKRIIHKEAMKRYECLIGLTLDEAESLCEGLGVGALYVSPRSGSNETVLGGYPQVWIDYIEKHHGIEVPKGTSVNAHREMRKIGHQIYLTPGTLCVDIRYRTDVISRIQDFITKTEDED